MPEPSKPPRTLTWLHLSDLHMCQPRTGWDAHRVLKTLVADLKQMESEHGLRPDLIFFTGDAAFGQLGDKPGESIKQQFAEAQKFFVGVRNAFESHVPLENVFIVPGNHDVNRSEFDEPYAEWLDSRKSLDPILEMLRSNNRQWKRFMERLADYRSFLSNHGYTHLLDDPDRLIYAQKREVKGAHIGIYGLNSAWSCGRDGEKGKLWSGGKWQISHLKSQLDDMDLRIGLIHHPDGWFGEYEEPQLSSEIEREFHFHLHGHEHKDWINQNADGNHTRIAAGACYEYSDHENGYNFVRIDLETGRGEVWLRHYESRGGGWMPHTVFGKTNNDGMWELRPCFQPPKPEPIANP